MRKTAFTAVFVFAAEYLPARYAVFPRKRKKQTAGMPAVCLLINYLYLRLRAASDFFLRFTEGFS